MERIELKIAVRGAEAAPRFLRGILALAKANGIDQATLASRAGISAESLSRLKRAGGCRLATAFELAAAAGAESLVVTPRRDDALQLSARKLSAGRRHSLSAKELRDALRRGRVPADQRGHLLAFFEELPIELLHDVALDEGFEFERLLALAKELGAEGETLEWLAEMAGDSLAPAP